MMPAVEALDRLAMAHGGECGGFATMAGFVIFRLGRIPVAGDSFEAHAWRLEVAEMAVRQP